VWIGRAFECPARSMSVPLVNLMGSLELTMSLPERNDHAIRRPLQRALQILVWQRLEDANLPQLQENPPPNLMD